MISNIIIPIFFFLGKHQSKLVCEIEKSHAGLVKINDGLAARSKKLIDVVKNCWEDPILMKLMNTKDVDIGPEGEFFYLFILN